MTRWSERVSNEPHRRPSHEPLVQRREIHTVSRDRETPQQLEQKTEPLLVEMPVVQPPAELDTFVPEPQAVQDPAPTNLQALTPIEPSKSSSSKRRRMPSLSRKPKLKWAVPVAMLALVSLGAYTVVNWSREPVKSNVLSAQTVEEVASISTDEEPVILYVTDKTKVVQPFLDKAENGDEVRLYYQARKAVLYRPSTYSVISVGEFTPPPAKVFIRNGTAGNIRVSKVETQLKNMQEYSVVSKDRSSSTSYGSTIVVDVSGRYKADAQKLAERLGATVASMPKGETTPEADILVIVGAN